MYFKITRFISINIIEKKIPANLAVYNVQKKSLRCRRILYRKVFVSFLNYFVSIL